jgi:hypothetical protein
MFFKERNMRFKKKAQTKMSAKKPMSREWFRKYLLRFFIILILFNIIDLLQTFYILNQQGGIELNPIMRTAIGDGGLQGFLLSAVVKVISLTLVFYLGLFCVNHPIFFYNKTFQYAMYSYPYFALSIYGLVNLFSSFQIIYGWWLLHVP